MVQRVPLVVEGGSAPYVLSAEKLAVKLAVGDLPSAFSEIPVIQRLFLR